MPLLLHLSRAQSSFPGPGRSSRTRGSGLAQEQQGPWLPPGTARARRPPAAAPARLPGPDPSPARRSLGCRRRRAKRSTRRLTAKWRRQARECRPRLRDRRRGPRATGWSGRRRPEGVVRRAEVRGEGSAFDAVCGRDPPEWAGECVVGVARFKRRGQEQAVVRLGLWEWPVQQVKVGRIGVHVFRSVVEIYRF